MFKINVLAGLYLLTLIASIVYTFGQNKSIAQEKQILNPVNILFLRDGDPT